MSELQKNNNYKNLNTSEFVFNPEKNGVVCPCEKNGGNYGDCRKDGRMKELINVLSECEVKKK